MAKYPVENADADGIADGVNYVLSGPSGIGQQLEGFSGYDSTQLTGNFRVPFTATGASLYVEPIPLVSSEWLDDYTWKYTFAAAQPSAPFSLGNPVRVTGVTPSDYNGTFLRIGVVECSTTYVICREQTPYPNPGVIGTGGQIELNVVDALNSGEGAEIATDANAFVSIDGGNSLVSIAAQVDISPFDYAVLYTDYPAEVPELNIYVLIYRYVAINVGTIPNPQYRFVPDKIISQELLYNAPLNDYTQGVPLTYTFVSGTSDAASGGIYTSQTSDSTSGLGTNARITLQVTAPGTAYSTGSTILSIDGGGNYEVGDTVTWLGTSFGGTTPANDLVLQVASISGTGDITLFNSVTGTSDVGSVGTYTNIFPVSTLGIGTGAEITLNITTAGTAYSTGSTITITNGGSNYQFGDILTVDGLSIGGLSGINDLVFNVASIGGTGDITVPPGTYIEPSVIDNPKSGLYWYLLEINVEPDYLFSAVAVKSITVNRRSLTAQVIKK
jgi:hypothetical protein